MVSGIRYYVSFQKASGTTVIIWGLTYPGCCTCVSQVSLGLPWTEIPRTCLGITRGRTFIPACSILEDLRGSGQTLEGNC